MHASHACGTGWRIRTIVLTIIGLVHGEAGTIIIIMSGKSFLWEYRTVSHTAHMQPILSMINSRDTN